MNLVRITDAPQYVPTNHPGVTSRRVQGREAGGEQRSAHNVGTEAARLIVIHRPGFDA